MCCRMALRVKHPQNIVNRTKDPDLEVLIGQWLNPIFALCQLTLREIGERAWLIYQLSVGSRLDHLSIYQNVYFVCIDNGTQSMGDHDSRRLQRIKAVRNG